MESSLKQDEQSKVLPRHAVHHKRVKSDVPDSSQVRKELLSGGASLVSGVKRKPSEKQSNPNMLYSDRTTPRKNNFGEKKLVKGGNAKKKQE